MKNVKQMVLVLGCAVVLAGCTTTGLSTYERGGFNYTNFVYGMYDSKESKGDKPIALKRPVAIAVAQVGENAPPQLALRKLDSERGLINKVVIIPAGSDQQNDYYGYGSAPKENMKPESFEERAVKMRRLAQDLGADYIFLIGGSAEMRGTQSWLGVLDFTIVGAFIFPTQQLIADGKAVGAFLDASTGRVVFIVNTQKQITTRATSYNFTGKQDELIKNLRDALTNDLTEKFIDQLKNF